jgi:hypothetical protein
MLRFILIVIGIIVSQFTAAHGDDFRRAVHAAYCLGVNQKAAHDLGLPITDDESREQSALIERALRSRRIDSGTVQRMTASGYADASACYAKQKECHAAQGQKKDVCSFAEVDLCDKLEVCMTEQDRRNLDDMMGND